MLHIKNLSVSIEDKKILDNISFDFHVGKTYALMGPNGSGKSTLAAAIMGHPQITYSRVSKILVSGKNIKNLSPDKRAKLGIFLSFQTPMTLPGVTVFELLRLALEKQIDPVTLHGRVKAYAKELHIKEELLKRSLNDGFSGGEKKKLEALQAVLLKPQFALFDEIDTGVDVDALKTISRFLKKHLSKKTTLVFITHSTRLLRYIKPQEVLIMKVGRLVKTGKGALAKKIEREGFEKIS
ncbi:MAG: Fe-S cluster assembly ATPase SufC [Candidatus Moranbacteria bacterium]|nr:Fe-S cluster assembly ATPase SufC [Candidatus Moranbacteria bacterium]